MSQALIEEHIYKHPNEKFTAEMLRQIFDLSLGSVCNALRKLMKESMKGLNDIDFEENLDRKKIVGKKCYIFFKKKKHF